VYLKDGQRLTGILVSVTEDELRVRIAGISTPLQLALVEKYDVLPPIRQRYLALRQAVGEDAEQIVQLARWLRERERYELALAEVQRALVIEPALASARSLKVQLEQQILLKIHAGDPDHAQSTQQGAAGKGRPISRPAEFPLLTPEQVNLLRVYEIDPTSKPRLVISRETITRLLEQNAGHPLVPITREGRESWYRKDPLEILELMFRLQARNLYGQVKVIDQPQVFESFRDDVHRTWLLNRCATNECHGGEEAGRLMLCNKRPNSDATVYTNFLILDRFKLSTGQPLINTDEPAKSPLLHLGLPREDSLFPHPPVTSLPGTRGRDAWRPIFNATDDRMFTEAIDWMRKLYRPRPDYPVTYTPPDGNHPLAPAEPPAAKPPSPEPGKEPIAR
jgi:hypothetical protein